MPVLLIKIWLWVAALFGAKKAAQEQTQSTKESNAVKKAQETGDTSDLENI